jgi:hypothetical protein
MAQFKVVLDEVKLDERQTAQINSAIQSTVLTELAKIDNQAENGSVLVKKWGPIWWGIIAYPIDVQKPNVKKLAAINAKFDQG